MVLVASYGSVHGGGGRSCVCAERSDGMDHVWLSLQVTFADRLNVFSIVMWMRRNVFRAVKGDIFLSDWHPRGDQMIVLTFATRTWENSNSNSTSRCTSAHILRRPISRPVAACDAVLTPVDDFRDRGGAAYRARGRVSEL